MHSASPPGIWGTIARGLVAGTAGTAGMTLGEKLEQAFTGRPNPFVPAHTLERLLGLTEKPDSQRLALNHLMHWGQGALVGAIRVLMARAGVRGPFASSCSRMFASR